MKYTQKKLQNGLNVFMLHVPDAQSVVFTVLIKVGSRYERAKINGVAHFLEHVFFKGSKKNPEPSSVNLIVDAIGGETNASTSKEFTEFYIKAEKSHFDLVYDTLTDMVLNPLFKDEELEKEKGVITEEINMYLDNPPAQVDSDLEKIMWPNSPLGSDILGTKETIRAMNRKKILEFKEKYYTPNNIILGISGNFNKKHVLEKVKKDWAKLKPKKIGALSKLKNSGGHKLKVINKKTQQAHLALGFKSFAHNDKRNIPIILLSAILGGSYIARLWLNIREQKGWAYYIRAGNAPYYQTGNFTINAGIKVDKMHLALKEILHEIHKIKTILVSEKELRRSKDYIKGRVALGLEDNNDKLDWLISRFAVSGKTQQPEEFFKKIEAVTAKEIQNVAKEIFQEKRASLVVIGPFKGNDFKKEFKT